MTHSSCAYWCKHASLDAGIVKLIQCGIYFLCVKTQEKHSEERYPMEVMNRSFDWNNLRAHWLKKKKLCKLTKLPPIYVHFFPFIIERSFIKISSLFIQNSDFTKILWGKLSITFLRMHTIPQVSTASFCSFDQKLFQRNTEICNCKSIHFYA